jgi:mono/diheme cytochrome c family protein
MIGKLPVAPLLALALLIGGCKAEGDGAPKAPLEQKGNAGMSALQDRSSTSPAGALFVEKCAMCHRQFGMGTVILARRVEKGQEMLENRPDLSVDFVRQAVRAGIGNMPRIGRGEVSDAELDTIAAYLAKGKAQ